MGRRSETKAALDVLHRLWTDETNRRRGWQRRAEKAEACVRAAERRTERAEARAERAEAKLRSIRRVVNGELAEAGFVLLGGGERSFTVLRGEGIEDAVRRIIDEHDRARRQARRRL